MTFLEHTTTPTTLDPDASQDCQVSCLCIPMGFVRSFRQRRFRPEPSPVHHDTSSPSTAQPVKTYHPATYFAAPPRQRIRLEAILAQMEPLTSTDQTNSVSLLREAKHLLLFLLCPGLGAKQPHAKHNNATAMTRVNTISHPGIMLARLRLCFRLHSSGQQTLDQTRDLLGHLFQSCREHSETFFCTIQREQAKLRKELAQLICQRDGV